VVNQGFEFILFLFLLYCIVLKIQNLFTSSLQFIKQMVCAVARASEKQHNTTTQNNNTTLNSVSVLTALYILFFHPQQFIFHLLV
jgi:hypothetical protein